MKQYFRIGEISKLYNISVDSLRYYEKLGLITPQRAESKYRMYSIHDIWRLNVIRELRELGFDMAEIASYLEKHSISSTVTLLEEELGAIQHKMDILRELRDNVAQRLQTIQSAEKKSFGIIEKIHCPKRRCFSIREGYSDDEEMDVLIKRLLNIDKQHFYVIGNNQIGSAIFLKDAENGLFRKYQSVFILDKNGEETIEEGSYLTVSYRGNCEQNTLYIPLLFDYARDNGLKITGDILELLWVDIHVSSDPKEHITELQVKVEQLP